MICKECPYYGAIDIDNDDNLVWGCTRKTCIEFTEEYLPGFPELDKSLYSDRKPYIEEELEIIF